jgi:predicted nuclease of predicted toxin-antitoxin system
MADLRVLTDEHVPSVAVTALRSEGFSVTTARERFGEQTVDPDLLVATEELDRTILTNDRDFVRIHEDVEHAGIVIYTTQSLGPDQFVRGLSRIDMYMDSEDLRGSVQWLEQWLE